MTAALSSRIGSTETPVLVTSLSSASTRASHLACEARRQICGVYSGLEEPQQSHVYPTEVGVRFACSGPVSLTADRQHAKQCVPKRSRPKPVSVWSKMTRKGGRMEGKCQAYELEGGEPALADWAGFLLTEETPFST
ncbi:hypothetical protein RRF57_008884 [Xylaria bambusicola]|uniref:Uncharacterized protein n=1 Tax=Xylaria bambusicola TaxID=326684 RepID=A0AAN7Z141_9PEZI